MDLKQSGKLPVSLYDAYVIACCQSSRTAVPTSSEKPMDWQALEQPNDYQDLLQRLAHCRDSSNRSTLLTNISDIFTELLAPLKPQPVVIEIDSFEIDAKQSQNNISQKVLLLKKKKKISLIFFSNFFFSPIAMDCNCRWWTNG